MENKKCEFCNDTGIIPGGPESGQSDEYIPERKCPCMRKDEND